MSVRLIRPFLFVLVLPVIKGAVQYLIYREISGILALEMAAITVISAIALIKSRLFTISVCGDALEIQNGIFFRTRSKISFSSLSSVTATRNLVDFIFKTATFYINTEAGKRNKPDFCCKLRVADARAIFKRVYGEGAQTAIAFSPIKISAMAATTSSAVMGLIIGVPIINNLGKLLGVGLSDMLLEEINNVSRGFNTYFPPIVNAITLIFIAAYAFSFAVSFVRYMRFRILVDKSRLEVRCGVFVSRRFVFKKSAINNVCIEQRPLMRLFGLFSMRASVAGYGNSKGERAVIMPCGSRREINRHLKIHFPRFSSGGEYIRAAATARERWRFLWVSVLLEGIIVTVTAAAMLIFPYFDRLIIFIGLVLSGLDLYYADLCRYNHILGRISFGENICARGACGLGFRELYCEKQKAGVIKVYTTPADRRYGTCKLKITVRSEGGDSIRVKNLDACEAKRKIKETFGIEV